MKKLFVVVIFLALSMNACFAQVKLVVNKAGEVLVEVLEPSFYFFDHPSTWSTSKEDHPFVFYPSHYTSETLPPFPYVTLDRHYDIILSKPKLVTVEATYPSGAHYEDVTWCRIEGFLKYDKLGRLIETDLRTGSGGERCAESQAQWKYRYTGKGLSKILVGSRYIAVYDRDKNGRLKSFMMGEADARPEEVYARLLEDMENGKTNQFQYSELSKFFMPQYEGDLLSGYICFEQNWPAFKVDLAYNEDGQLMSYTEIWEDDKNHRVKIEFSYNEGRIASITVLNYADNWENRITTKSILDLNYDGGKVDHLIHHYWDSYKWDNSYYEGPAEFSSKIDSYTK